MGQHLHSPCPTNPAALDLLVDVLGKLFAHVGSSEERQLQQGTGTAILQRQQQGCPWPKQLRARLLQITEVFAVVGHKVIILPA